MCQFLNLCYQNLGPEEGTTEQRRQFWSSSDLVKENKGARQEWEFGEVCTDHLMQGGVQSRRMDSTLN